MPAGKVNILNEVEKFLSKDIAFGKNRLSDKKKEYFYRNIHLLLSSGLDVKSCIDMLADENDKSKDKLLYQEIKNSLVSGDLFSNALKASGKFSPYEYYSVSIGEETGNLVPILAELKSFYVRKNMLKRQLLSALTYPALVLIVAFGAIMFMLGYVVPMYASILSRFGSGLPSITKFVIKLSIVAKAIFPYMLLLIIILIFLLYIYRNNIWFRKYFSIILLAIPLMGKIIRKIQISKLCMSLNLLLGSKVSLQKSFFLASEIINFYPIQSSLKLIIEDIHSGTPLHKAMAKYTIYEPRMIALIKVGEEVNKLDTIFGSLYQQYTEDIEQQYKILTSLLEPIIILVLGGVVAIILIAMYLPMFQVGNTI
jgi:type IV pilus assembly protein PilC